MIVFNEGVASSYTYVTLEEKRTTGDFYLWSVENEQTKEITNVVIDPTQESERYTVFNIIPANIGAERAGSYTYKIYEQDDSENTSVEATNGLLEEGKIFVKGLIGKTSFGGSDLPKKAFK